jgi:hypothetical protein
VLGFLLWRLTQSELTYEPVRLPELANFLLDRGVIAPERQRVLTRLLWFLTGGAAVGVFTALALLRVLRTIKPVPAAVPRAADGPVREALS